MCITDQQSKNNSFLPIHTTGLFFPVFDDAVVHAGPTGILIRCSLHVNIYSMFILCSKSRYHPRFLKEKWDNQPPPTLRWRMDLNIIEAGPSNAILGDSYRKFWTVGSSCLYSEQGLMPFPTSTILWFYAQVDDMNSDFALFLSFCSIPTQADLKVVLENILGRKTPPESNFRIIQITALKFSLRFAF